MCLAVDDHTAEKSNLLVSGVASETSEGLHHILMYLLTVVPSSGSRWSSRLVCP
jgi:hypothetical protein